jgi:hypothetical protein
MTTSTANRPDVVARRSYGIAPAVLVGGAFALTTIANTLFHVTFSIWNIRDDFGAGDRSPEEQLPVIIVIGVIGLLAALGIGKWLSEGRASQGAVVLGVLSVLSLPVFFSGAPASLGAMAAVRAGFARGGSPTSGAPRWFGIAGIVDRRAEHRRRVWREYRRDPRVGCGVAPCHRTPAVRRYRTSLLVVLLVARLGVVRG